MDTFELSFEVQHVPEDKYDDLMVDLDATVSRQHGPVVVALSVDAETAAAATSAAIDRLGAHNVKVVRLRENLVSRRDIAERCGVTPAAVGQWIRGERGPGEFPAAFSSVASGVWWWAEVNEWLRLIGRHDGGRYLSRDEHTTISYDLLRKTRLGQGAAARVALPVLSEHLSGAWRATVRWPTGDVAQTPGSTFDAPPFVMRPGTHAVTTVRAETVRAALVLTA